MLAFSHALKNKRYVFACLLVWILAAPVNAMLVFEDATGNLTAEQVLQTKQTQFVERDKGYVGFTDSVWWIKTSLNNAENSPEKRYINFDLVNLQYVDAYFLEGGQLIQRRNGYSVPPAERFSYSTRNIFEFALAPNEQRDVLFRVQSNFLINLNHKEFSREEVIAETAAMRFVQALTVAAMVIMLLIAALNFFITKDSLLKFYFPFVLMHLVYVLIEINWLSFFPFVGKHFLVFFSLPSGLAYILGIQFLKQLFSDIKSVWLSRIANSTSIFMICVLGLFVVDEGAPLAAFLSFGGPVVFIGYIGLLVIAIKHKHYLARWVLVPWAVFVLSSIFNWMQFNGMVDAYYSLPAYAAAFEAFMFASILTVKTKKHEKYLNDKISFQGFIDHLGSGFVAYRHKLDGEFEWVNGNTFAIFKAQPHEIIGRKLSEFLPFDAANAEKLAALKQSLMGMNNQNKNLTEIFDFKDINGKVNLSIEIYAHVALDENGEKVAFEGICQDVTLREANRRETAVLKDKLEERILYQNQMFSVISHELRTPLASTKMLYDEMRIDYSLPYGPTLRENNQALLSILDSLKIVVNPSAVIEEKQRAISPALHIERAIQSINALFIQYDFTLHFTFDQGSQEFMLISSNSLRQIILNITKNALIHSGGANLWIDVSSENINQKKASLTVLIEDDGKGIDAKKRDRLFEPFVRGDTTADGSGLGLFIINNLVNHLNGSVEYFESEHGGAGWRFSFVFNIFRDASESLSLSVLEHKTQPAVVNEEKPELPPPYSLEGKTILYAEDQLTIQMLTKRLFEKAGAQEVVVANDGVEAMQAFAKKLPDLVVTDAMMPNKDGYELCGDIRRAGYEGLIVAVTAATIGNEKQRLLKEGADIVLPKPLVMQDFVQALTLFKPLK